MCKPGDVLRERANCTSLVRNFAASGTFAVRPATCYWWAPLRNPTRKGTDTSLVALIQVSWYQMPLVGRALPISMLWDCLPEEGIKIWREQSVTKRYFEPAILPVIPFSSNSTFSWWYVWWECSWRKNLDQLAWHTLLCHLFIQNLNCIENIEQARRRLAFDITKGYIWIFTFRYQ